MARWPLGVSIEPSRAVQGLVPCISPGRGVLPVDHLGIVSPGGSTAYDNCVIVDIALVLIGLIMLIGGGEVLVRGASALAIKTGLSPLIVGLTVVSVATSAPELAVTTGAVLSGETDLAIGNVVGSNIANVFLILGVCAVITPLTVRRQMLKMDLPLLAGMSLALLFFAMNGRIGTWEGLLLLGLWVGYIALSIRSSRGMSQESADVPDTPIKNIPGAAILVLLGVGLLVFGSQFLVDGAVAIASSLGVSGLVIGLTVVAIGTSMPELAASGIAALRGQTDLAVGNVVGSCLANIGLVLGLPSLLAPGGLVVPASVAAFDVPIMLAAVFGLIVVAFTGAQIVSWEGLAFLGLYVAYTCYVVLAATHHDALEGFSSVMVAFVLPVLGAALLASFLHELKHRAQAAKPRVT